MKNRIPIFSVSVMFLLFAYTILTTPVKTPPDYTPQMIPYAIRTVGSLVNYPALLAGFWIMKKADASRLPIIVASFMTCFAVWGSIVYFGIKKGIALTK